MTMESSSIGIRTMNAGQAGQSCVRVGIIGCGAISEFYYAPALREFEKGSLSFLSQIEDARTLHRKRIAFGCDLIMENPLETNETRADTLKLMLQMPRPFRLITFPLTHFPETRLTETLLERGMISPNDVEDVKSQMLLQGVVRWAKYLDPDRKSA